MKENFQFDISFKVNCNDIDNAAKRLGYKSNIVAKSILDMIKINLCAGKAYTVKREDDSHYLFRFTIYDFSIKP
jgi:hypothetical protein